MARHGHVVRVIEDGSGPYFCLILKMLEKSLS